MSSPAEASRTPGARLVIYSTPCLFAAQPAIEEALLALQRQDSSLPASPIGVKECTQMLEENLARRRAPRVLPRDS